MEFDEKLDNGLFEVLNKNFEELVLNKIDHNDYLNGSATLKSLSLKWEKVIVNKQKVD